MILRKNIAKKIKRWYEIYCMYKQTKQIEFDEKKFPGIKQIIRG